MYMGMHMLCACIHAYAHLLLALSQGGGLALRSLKLLTRRGLVVLLGPCTLYPDVGLGLGRWRRANARKLRNMLPAREVV